MSLLFVVFVTVVQEWKFVNRTRHVVWTMANKAHDRLRHTLCEAGSCILGGVWDLNLSDRDLSACN